MPNQRRRSWIILKPVICDPALLANTGSWASNSWDDEQAAFDHVEEPASQASDALHEVSDALSRDHIHFRSAVYAESASASSRRAAALGVNAFSINASRVGNSQLDR